MRTEFCWGNLKARDHVENLDIDGRMIIKMDIK